MYSDRTYLFLALLVYFASRGVAGDAVVAAVRPKSRKIVAASAHSRLQRNFVDNRRVEVAEEVAFDVGNFDTGHNWEVEVAGRCRRDRLRKSWAAVAEEMRQGSRLVDVAFVSNEFNVF
jgi:hypothetical protein